MTLWQGIEVLDLVEHNRSEPLSEIVRRRFASLGGRTGIVRVHAPTKAPDPLRPFHWTAFSRADAAEIKSFLDARRGVCEPFWLPSYQSDLVLAADVPQSETILPIRRCLYSRLMFPGTGARRHLALHRRGQPFTFLRVVDADDPGPGNPETVTVDPGLPQAFPALGTTIMFLKLCRLDDGLTEISWLSTGGGIADAILRAREIPNEAPT